MKHLYFVRHGLSVMNQQGVWSGVTDTPLTNEGKEQARQAGLSLIDKQIDCVVSSPVKRAYDTAEIIAEQLDYEVRNILVNGLFAERDFGPLEGTTYNPDHPLDSTAGVEHSEDLMKRVREGFAFLQTLEADTVLVVSHGAVGRALRAITESGTTFHTSPKFNNAEVVKLI